MRLPRVGAASHGGLAATSPLPLPAFPWHSPKVTPLLRKRRPHLRRVTLKLNGDTMQDQSTKDMLFGIARLVSYISQSAQLLPIDLVLTDDVLGTLNFLDEAKRREGAALVRRA